MGGRNRMDSQSKSFERIDRHQPDGNPHRRNVNPADCVIPAIPDIQVKQEYRFEILP